MRRQKPFLGLRHLFSKLIFFSAAGLCCFGASALSAKAAKNNPSAKSTKTDSKQKSTSPVNASILESKDSSVAHNLSAAFLAAVERAESIAIQREQLDQAEELEKQAWASLLPSVNATATFQRQQTPTNVVANSIFPSTQNTIKLYAVQPLFRGLRDFAALRQKKAQTSAQVFVILNAAKQLFYDTANAFYNVLAYQADETNYVKEIASSQKRLEELKQFLKIGRCQLSDLLTFQSNVAALEVLLENVRQQLEISKDILAFVTGWPRDTKIADASPIDLELNQSVETYLANIEKRPDVMAAAETLKAYEENLAIAKGGHLPNVDFVVDYFFERPGSLHDVHWDGYFSISIPLFQGGIIESQIRSAASGIRQYQLQLSLVKRTAEEEIRIIYDSFTGGRKQILKVQHSVELSKQTYQAQIQNYRNGLVTNLEVLQALTSYMDSQRILDHQSQIARLDQAKLQAASAQRSELQIKTRRSL